MAFIYLRITQLKFNSLFKSGPIIALRVLKTNVLCLFLIVALCSPPFLTFMPNYNKNCIGSLASKIEFWNQGGAAAGKCGSNAFAWVPPFASSYIKAFIIATDTTRDLIEWGFKLKSTLWPIFPKVIKSFPFLKNKNAKHFVSIGTIIVGLKHVVMMLLDAKLNCQLRLRWVTTQQKFN